MKVNFKMPVPAYSFEYATKATNHQVASPCIDICNISNDTGLCEGCFRTLDEIALWSQMDNVAKREVWSRITQRAAQSKPSSSDPQGIEAT